MSVLAGARRTISAFVSLLPPPPHRSFCALFFSRSFAFFLKKKLCSNGPVAEAPPQDEEIRRCITTLACHREGDTSPTGRIDFCERCAGPVTSPTRKPLVRIAVTGLRTVRNPVAVTMEPLPPQPGTTAAAADASQPPQPQQQQQGAAAEQPAAVAAPSPPDVLCYVYDACKGQQSPPYCLTLFT